MFAFHLVGSDMYHVQAGIRFNLKELMAKFDCTRTM